MTGTPVPPPTAGLEYTIVPPGVLLSEWGSINIGWDECVPLNGYIISTRYRDWVSGPNGYIPVYPPWELISQELIYTSHTEPFQQQKPFFTANPGLYGTSISGIVDGSCYDYFKIFDQSSVAYLEANGPYDSTPIENETIPDPIDALTRFRPDTRESVTVAFQLETKYNLGVLDATDILNVTQVVTQDTNNWSAQVKGYVNGALFTLGERPQK